MTPEAKRIAIAEACGWERWKSKSGKVALLIPKNEYQRAYWIECGDSITTQEVNWWNTTQHVPDYLTDLNAMHEAEKMLSTEPQPRPNRQPEEPPFVYSAATQYRTWLERLTHADPYCATAAQRADALLYTLNLFE